MYNLGESTQKEYKKKNNKEHFLMMLPPLRWIVPYKWRGSWKDWLFTAIVIAAIAWPKN